MTSHLKNRTDRQKAESTKCKELVFQKKQVENKRYKFIQTYIKDIKFI